MLSYPIACFSDWNIEFRFCYFVSYIHCWSCFLKMWRSFCGFLSYCCICASAILLCWFSIGLMEPMLVSNRSPWLNLPSSMIWTCCHITPNGHITLLIKNKVFKLCSFSLFSLNSSVRFNFPVWYLIASVQMSHLNGPSSIFTTQLPLTQKVSCLGSIFQSKAYPSTHALVKILVFINISQTAMINSLIWKIWIKHDLKRSFPMEI